MPRAAAPAGANRQTNGLMKFGGVLRQTTEIQGVLTAEIFDPQDLAYTYSLFLQCFMPLRHNAANQRRWHA